MLSRDFVQQIIFTLALLNFIFVIKINLRVMNFFNHA